MAKTQGSNNDTTRTYCSSGDEKIPAAHYQHEIPSKYEQGKTCSLSILIIQLHRYPEYFPFKGDKNKIWMWASSVPRHPGFCQKWRCQQEQGSYPSVLSAGQATSPVLCSVLDSSLQEGPGGHGDEMFTPSEMMAPHPWLKQMSSSSSYSHILSKIMLLIVFK